MSVLNEEVLRKRVFGGFPNLCCPERWSGMNRISHPDWVKLCVDPNGQIKLRAKQKYKILSATSVSTKTSSSSSSRVDSMDFPCKIIVEGSCFIYLAYWFS